MLKDKCVNELGFEQAYIDNVGNIIATKGNGEPRVLLCGHMDTVPGGFLLEWKMAFFTVGAPLMPRLL